MVLHATVQGVRLHTLDVTVSGVFDNILEWAGRAEPGNSGYRAIDISASVSADADEDTLRDIWERALAGSAVAQSLVRATPVMAVMEVVDRPASEA